MHTIKYIVLGFGILFTLYSCETDFDTTADWKDLTVVYGIIDQNDSIQYIKINRAFLGEGNVIKMAQEYDSINYPFPLSVRIEELNENNQVVQSIELDTSTSYKPDEPDAVFHTGAQRIYKGGPDTFYEIKWFIDPPFDTVGFRKLWLNDQNIYKLSVVFPDESKLVTGETQLIQDFLITKPVPGQKTIKFVPSPALPYNFEWEKAANDEGKFKYEFQLIFHYQELTFNNVIRDKSIDLVSSVNVSPSLGSSKLNYYYFDNNFFTSCENKIPYDDPVEEDNIKERYTGNIEIIISVAGEAFNLFMQVYEPSTSIVQERPPYTNLENGIGIFSSRYRINDRRILADETKFDLKSIEQLKFER